MEQFGRCKDETLLREALAQTRARKGNVSRRFPMIRGLHSIGMHPNESDHGSVLGTT